MLNFTKKFILVFFILITNCYANIEALPDLGSPTDYWFSTQAESKLGKQIFTQLETKAALTEDILANAYLNSLGEKLSSYAPRHPFKIKFFIVQDNQINAFALPGGYIGINSGLIDILDSEAELAGVLAHEIAHVTQRHLAQMVLKQKETNLTSIAIALAGIALTGQSSNAASGAFALSIANQQQRMLNFSRIQEIEADRIGRKILQGAGYHPSATIKVFEKLSNYETLQISGISSYLSTHPASNMRISEAQSANTKVTPVLNTNFDNFLLFKARIQALNANNNFSEKKIKNTSKINSQFFQASQYKNVLTHIKNTQYKQASNILENLLKQAPDNIFYLFTRLDLLLLQKSPLLAEFINNLNVTFPNDRYILMKTADIALNSAKPEWILPNLKKYMLTHPNDLALTKRYIQLIHQQGNIGLSLELTGDLATKAYHKQHAYHYYSEAIKFAKNAKQKKRIQTKMSALKKHSQ